MIGFEFPPLGATGEGEIIYPPGKSREDFSPGEHPLYWKDSDNWQFYVLYQLDRPACAFRCYYPGGASPCDRETADRFIKWAKAQMPATATFAAGDGTRYGLVSLPGSDQVVVFRRHSDGVWRGNVQFGPADSMGVAPGDAIPEIADLLNQASDQRTT